MAVNSEDSVIEEIEDYDLLDPNDDLFDATRSQAIKGRLWKPQMHPAKRMERTIKRLKSKKKVKVINQTLVTKSKKEVLKFTYKDVTIREGGCKRKKEKKKTKSPPYQPLVKLRLMTKVLRSSSRPQTASLP